ncbi:MAG TPA: hypothetical protein VK701_05465 [Solirubrobacteraceae bacterium]|nr:hypothetical protein [Solirubrobacteraceae bacterium]
MELDQLLLLAVEFAELAAVSIRLFLGHQRLSLGMIPHGLGDGLLLLLREHHAVIHALNRALGRLDRDVGSLATATLADSRQATEVLIHTAAGALVASVAEPTATGAVDRPLQVMAVLMGAVAAGPVGSQDVLDTLEDLPLDDRLMDALALDSLERDDANVEVVAQHPVDHRAVHRFTRLFGCGPIPEPGVFQDVDHLRDGVVAGRKQLKGHLHQFLAVRVGYHNRYFAVADDLLGVEIADGRWPHVATG